MTSDGTILGDEIDRLAEQFSVHNPDVQRDWEAVTRRLRGQCPLVKSKAHGGFYPLTRYSDLYAAAHDPETFSSFPVTIPPFGNPVPMIPIEMDPPMHAKYRTLVGGRFTLTAVAKLEERLRGIVTELLDAVDGLTEVDLVKALAVPLPLRVILEVYLDVPAADWEHLYELFLQMLQPDPTASDEEKHDTAMTAGFEAMVYFAGLLDQRRQAGYGDDLISALDQVEIDGERLTEEEILGFCLVLVPAGFDTTASALGRLFLLLGERPDLRERLRSATPALLDTAVEEFIRYISPVPGLARTVTKGCTFAGTELEEGDRVLLCFPSANRDEEEFPNPDEIDIERQPNRHVAFGSGAHRCIGAHVARAEIKFLITEFLRRMPDYRIAESGVAWHTGDTWGLKALPVIFEWD